MAEPHDSATILEDVSAVIQQQYFARFEEQTSKRFGSITNRVMKMEKEPVTGDGKTMQVELAPYDGVRFDTDPLGAFAAPDKFEAGTLKVRFNRQNPAVSDFSKVSASAQVDDIDVQLAGRGSIVDFVKRIANQILPNYDETLAIHRNIGRSARLALVNGTPRQNNAIVFTSASSTPTNTTGVRIQVDTGSIAYFRRGRRVDFINPSNGAVRAGNIYVTDVNTADLSVGLKFITSGTSIATHTSNGDLSTVADNDIIVLSGEYNKGMYSIGEYFTRPTAGESFIGGVDRTTEQYRWLLTTAIREGSTSAQINKSMFNDLAIAMGFKSEDQYDGMVFVTDLTIHQSLRDQIGEDAFRSIPVDDTTKERFANFGDIGVNYQHGVFGPVKIMADPLCPSNTVRVINTSTWKSLYYAFSGLRAMPGDGGGADSWYRLNEPTPNTGRGLIWKKDYYALQCDWCTKPWLNGQILNVTA